MLSKYLDIINLIRRKLTKMITDQDRSAIEYSIKNGRVPLGRTFYGVILFGTEKELIAMRKEELLSEYMRSEKFNT